MSVNQELDEFRERISNELRSFVACPRNPFPKSPEVPEIRPQARVLVERPYLTLYETHPDTDDGLIAEVEIVRILHDGRDLRRLL